MDGSGPFKNSNEETRQLVRKMDQIKVKGTPLKSK